VGFYVLFLLWRSLLHFPTVTAKLYGPSTGPKIYPIIFSGFFISTLLGVVLAIVIIPILKDREDAGEEIREIK